MTDGVPVAGPTGAPTSYGAQLAAARQQAGLTVTDIAARLRLHPNQVRAIEQENLAALPELAYVRGFVRSYARLLKLDPVPILADLNARAAKASGSVVDGMTSNGDYSPVRAAAREQNSRRLVIGLAVASLLALALIGWLARTQWQTPPAAGPTSAVTPRPADPAPDITLANATNSAESTMAAAPDTDASAAPVEAETTAAPASDQSVEPAAAAKPAPVLQLSFNGSTWVQVLDGTGKAVLSGTEKSGAVHELQGPLPMLVVIGDAAMASVAVRGKPMDLGPVTRGNVARFRVE